MNKALNFIALFPLSLLLLATACTKKDGPQCSAVADKVVELLKRELDREAGPKENKVARANLPNLKSALQKQCESQDWELAQKKCVLESQSAAALGECAPQLPLDGQKR